MSKEYTIYTRWLAYELRRQGFRIIRTDINENHPQYDCWVFEDCPDLHMAIRYLTEQKKH